MLEAADVHVAQRLGALAEEPEETVLLAAALAVRAARSGAVCVDLDRVDATVTEIEPDRIDALPWPDRAAWREAVESSALARVGVLRLDAGSALPRPALAGGEAGLRRPDPPAGA